MCHKNDYIETEIWIGKILLCVVCLILIRPEITTRGAHRKQQITTYTVKVEPCLKFSLLIFGIGNHLRIKEFA